MFVQVKRKIRMGLVDKIEINYKILPSFSLIESNIFYIIFEILIKKYSLTSITNLLEIRLNKYISPFI